SAAPPRFEKGLARRRRWGRFGEFCRVNRSVRLHVAELNDGPPVEPGHGPVKWHLHSGDFSIVTIIDLCGNAPDPRVGVAYHPHQQSRLLVKEKRGENTPSAGPLKDLDLSVLDRSG